MTAQSIVVWFANAYRLVGLDGCLKGVQFINLVRHP
jgi:hypothetical protein